MFELWLTDLMAISGMDFADIPEPTKEILMGARIAPYESWALWVGLEEIYEV